MWLLAERNELDSVLYTGFKQIKVIRDLLYLYKKKYKKDFINKENLVVVKDKFGTFKFYKLNTKHYSLRYYVVD